MNAFIMEKQDFFSFLKHIGTAKTFAARAWRMMVVLKVTKVNRNQF